MKAFKFTSASNGYGARFWFRRSEVPPDVKHVLDTMSVWRGSDKTADDEVSWEFDGRLAQAVFHYLEEVGFTEYKQQN